MDRFLKYTTGREPVISTSVIAALILGAIVLAGERMGVEFGETELFLLGTVAIIAAGWAGRHFAVAPQTYSDDVHAALHMTPPEETE